MIWSPRASKVAVQQSREGNAPFKLFPLNGDFLLVLLTMLCVLVLTVPTGEAGDFPEGPSEHARFDQEGNPLAPSAMELGLAEGGVKVAGLGDVLNAFLQPPDVTAGLTIKDGNLWGMAGYAGVIHEMDPSTGAVISTLHLNPGSRFDKPGGLGYDSTRGLFVATDAWLNEVLLIDPITGEIVSSFPSPGEGPYGAAYDSIRDGYWVADWESERLDLVDATSHVVLKSCEVCCNTRIAGVGYSADADLLMFNERHDRRTHIASANDCTMLGDFPIPVAGINNGQGAAIRSSTRSGFLTNTDNHMIYEVDLADVFVTPSFEYWVAAVSHAGGAAGSVWRSDLAMLNGHSDSAQVTLTMFMSSGVSYDFTTTVDPSGQLVIEDVVSSFGVNGSGALKIESSRTLRITSRTYNLGSGGTFGQFMGCFEQQHGLAHQGNAWLTQLSQNSDYRTNIGFANMSDGPSSVSIVLYRANGVQVGEFTITIPPGQWVQENQPFLNRFGQSNVTGGFARVQVVQGSGIVAYASVVDSRTNDPTTIPMQR